MSRDDGPPPDDGASPRRPAPKPPSSYRPDLRPMLILVGVLVVVVLGWIVLSPIILPSSVR